MTITSYLFAGVLGLLGIGFYGLQVSRNLIKVVVALQILVKSALLALIAAGAAVGQINLSQSLVITVIVADTIIAVIGTALAVQLRKHTGSLDIQEFSRLRG